MDTIAKNTKKTSIKSNGSVRASEKPVFNGQNAPLKSAGNRKCITQCYKKGHSFVHPVLLQNMFVAKNDVCAIDPVPVKDPPHNVIYLDQCNLSDNDKYVLPNELESLLLSFYFSPIDFLENIYNIHSFDETINWTLENDHLPFDTIKRVHNCSWRVFGLSGELSNLVLEYYFDIARNHWLKDYVKMIQNKYSFTIFSDQNVANASEEIYKIIYQDFLTYDFFVKCIKKYISEYRDKWDVIKSHYGAIKKFVFSQLVLVIEKVSNR